VLDGDRSPSGHHRMGDCPDPKTLCRLGRPMCRVVGGGGGGGGGMILGSKEATHGDRRIVGEEEAYIEERSHARRQMDEDSDR
jgi:hypothetical protein